jgi:type IX secretion system PorP/SprF family membrane protein
MKKILFYLILVIFNLPVSAQVPPLTNQYILNPITLNPAYAGNRGALNIAAFYRHQWAGITGAPRTMTLAVDAPLLSNKLGLGLVIMNDHLGVTKQNQVQSSFAYRINMGDGSLSFGLGFGLLTTNTAWSDLVVLDPGDEYYLIDSRIFAVPDFSFGTYYNFKNYFFGFSIPRLLGYQFDFNRNKYSIIVEPLEYYYLFNTGYRINLSAKTKLLTSTLVSFSPGEKLLYDVSAHVNLFDKVWFGGTYRSTNSVNALCQFAVNNQFRIAYSFEYDFGPIGTYNSGSHEIMLRYEFRYTVNAVNPLIF